MVTKDYTCPMHPDVQRAQPGLCPQCGMQLVPTAKKTDQPAGAEHKRHEHGHHSKNIFRTRFWVSLVLTIPVLALSDFFSALLPARLVDFPGSAYVPAVLTTIIFFYGGGIFITSAYRELRARLPGMMTLIALATSVAYVYSLVVIATGKTNTLFWELATLITVMLLGHWMEMRAVSSAQRALSALSKLLPDTAEVQRDGVSVVLPIKEIQRDDIVLVKPGGTVPVDGVVTEGLSEVDESLLSGETSPVAKAAGDQCIAGSLNGDGALSIRVTKIGSETFLAGIQKLVAQAQASKSRLQLLSDRAALYLTGIAIVTGGATLVTWLLIAEPAFAFERSVAVLVIACPHALGLAIPLVASISTSKAARNGFLVKQRSALELARSVDIVVLDKTGTLTKGSFGVRSIVPSGAHGELDVLLSAASVNAQSEHPIAAGILAAAKQKRLTLAPVTRFERVAGRGAKGLVSGQQIVVGNTELLHEQRVEVEPAFEQRVAQQTHGGATVVFVARNGQLMGALVLEDIIRDESKQAVLDLNKMNIQTVLLTGDAQSAAERVARELGIVAFEAGVKPEQKIEKVRSLQAQGKKVAFVGDGINDAAALSQADVGIAIGAGTNVAIESAGIILVKNNVRDVVKLIRLSRLTYTKMIQNLFWAAGYNVVAIPLAAGVLAYWGVILQPALGAFFMSLSTVLVAANAMLLRRKTL